MLSKISVFRASATRLGASYSVASNGKKGGPKGDGDMPHPKEYVDGLEPVKADGEEASQKEPTRSTGIKTSIPIVVRNTY